MPDTMEDRIVLCGANAYEKKYYFNEQFAKMPENISRVIPLPE